jgi:hypothetical protein
MYDVFLSHNRLQKPWVRTLYEFLTARGLSVFFDEESIPPGTNIVRGIEEGLEQSRHVVLVLSPSSVASKWVAMETQLTVHDDPDARRGTLVPVLIEHVDFDKLRPSVRSVNCIDLTDEERREERIRFLLRHIGVRNIDAVPSAQLQGLLSVARKGGASALSLAGVGEVLRWGWDGIRLLDEFIRLDYETLDELVPAHEGHSKQWAPIFMNHPDTWRMLISGPETIAGYWHFAPLFPDDHELAKSGSLVDSEITADRVQLFELPGYYNVYFVQICLLPQFRSARNIRLLFHSVFSVLDSLALDGIFISQICANAYTDVGRALCKSFRLQYLREHKEHGSLYVGSVRDVLQCPIASSFPMLQKRYKEQETA